MKIILEKNLNNMVVGYLDFDSISEQYKEISMMNYPKDQDIVSWLSIKFNYLYEVKNIRPEDMRDYSKNFGPPRKRV